jgi:carbonic anhydrase
MFAAATAWASGGSSAWSSEDALGRLQSGNERFVEGKPNRWNAGEARREKLSAGQQPYACVITCSDSRVPPELIFDTGLGELFTIRMAGNVVTPEVVASADYAVGHLNCPVVVVMGHSNCGAVGAAMAESEYPEPLNTLIEQIRPSVDACHQKGYYDDDLYEAVIRENARSGAQALLSGSREIEEAVAQGRCVVLSAVYDLSTGEVSWQSQMQAALWSDAKPAAKKSTEIHEEHDTATHSSRQSVGSTKTKH